LGSGTSRAGDGVRLKPLTVVDIPDVNILPVYESGPVHQILVYSDAADVVDVAASNCSAVDLAFAEC
jgi:hypothetical protein